VEFTIDEKRQVVDIKLFNPYEKRVKNEINRVL